MEEIIEIEYTEILNETEKAVLLLIEDDWEEWVPKSQILSHDEEGCIMEIPRWLAEAKGLY